MTKIKFDGDRWGKCGKCGHKLFRVMSGNPIGDIEVKCHSCKELNTTERSANSPAETFYGNY